MSRNGDSNTMYGPAPTRPKKTGIVRARTGCKQCRLRRKKVSRSRSDGITRNEPYASATRRNRDVVPAFATTVPATRAPLNWHFDL